MKCPRNFNKSLSLKTLAEGYCKSIENAQRLMEDGRILIENKRYLGAISYLRLATEELAKAHLINQPVFYNKNDEENLYKEPQRYQSP